MLQKREKRYSDFETLPDPATETLLLPSWFAGRDNAREHQHRKRAIRQAVLNCLTPVQQEQIRLFYGSGLRKSEIARRQKCTCSAVSKSMKAAECAIRQYAELYMRIYKDLEREFLDDEINGTV